MPNEAIAKCALTTDHRLLITNPIAVSMPNEAIAKCALTTDY